MRWKAKGRQTALAKRTKVFLPRLPPARTQRESLMAGLLEQTRRQRPRELEMTR